MRMVVVALTLCLLAPAAAVSPEATPPRTPGETVATTIEALAGAASVPSASIDPRACGSLADEVASFGAYLGLAQVPAVPALPAAEAEAIAGLVCALHDASLARDAAYVGVDWRILAEDVLSATEQPRSEITPDMVAANAAGARHIARAVDAALPLLTARAHSGIPVPGLAPPEFELAPILAFDTIGLDTLYDTDVALVVDVGGNDLYANNAGGAFIAFGNGGFLPVMGDPSSFGPSIQPVTGGPRIVLGGDFEDAELLFAASLVLDLEGDDTYGVRKAPWTDAQCTSDPVVRKVAIQGTGAGGPGMLFDLAGDNLFLAKTMAQGIGHVGGVGVMYLGPGNDRLEAVRFAQGVGLFFGLALLVNEGGDDEYVHIMPRGGVFNTDSGFCDDAPRYQHGVGFARVTGSAVGVAGAFIDQAGNDLYIGGAKSLASAELASVGIFIDAAGDDTYQALGKSMGYASGHVTNYGGGGALFYDAEGNDRYTLLDGLGIGASPGRLAGPEEFPPPSAPYNFWVNRVVTTFVDPLLLTGGAAFVDGAGTDVYTSPELRVNNDVRPTNLGAVFADLG